MIVGLNRECFAFNLEYGDRVTDAVLIATRQYYDGVRPRYVDFLGADGDELMPVLSDTAELSQAD